MKTAAILYFFVCFGCFGQAPGPSFEVASIRPNPEVVPSEIHTSSGSLTIRNQPFLFLVQWAYDVPRVQIEGPVWFRDACFDISAKSAGPADETQLRLMLQKLLADRFGLKLHKEARVMPVYAMTLAKGGPKFQEATTEGTFALERSGPVILNAHHARTVDLAEAISGEIGRPVVDETGLRGRYEIHLDVTPYISRANGSEGQLDVMGILFTGLQELLGLKLESRKESVDVFVIDHAEKMPTEN
jgi:uncharacterized protein (TIGR03435 family)